MDKKIDIERIPIEVKLILELLKENPSVQPFENCKIDWDLFLNYTVHHRLYPKLYLKIKENEFEFIPASVMEYLMHLYKRNTFSMLQLSAEMELVSKLFAEQGIHTLFLKGPVVAQDLYGSISQRTCGDLDFLILIEHLQEAESILTALGYEKDDYIETVLNDWRWRHHHVTYYHPMKQTKLEIHWRLHPGPGRETSFPELWYRKRKSSLTQFPVYYLGREDLFQFLVVHGVRHGWSRLRWLDDIQQLCKLPLDWTVINKLFKRDYQIQIAGQSLILINELLDISLNKEMQQMIIGNKPYHLAQEAIFYLERIANLHSEPLPKEIAKHHQKYVLNSMSMQQKSLYLISLMHPFPEDAAALPLPKQMHFLYYPLRPFLWAWRKIRKPVLS